jgi:hypothetical protein
LVPYEHVGLFGCDQERSARLAGSLALFEHI